MYIAPPRLHRPRANPPVRRARLSWISPEHARLLAPGPGHEPLWRDAWALAHPGQPHAPTVGLHAAAPDAAPFTFDYVCVSPALASRVRAVRVDTAATGSDHQPLILEIA